MADRGVSGQNVGDFSAARRHIIALVQNNMIAPQIVDRLGGALAVGTVGQHQNFAVLRHKTAKHRFDQKRS